VLPDSAPQGALSLKRRYQFLITELQVGRHAEICSICAHLSAGSRPISCLRPGARQVDGGSGLSRSLDGQGRLERLQTLSRADERPRLPPNDGTEMAHLQGQRILLRHDLPFAGDGGPPAVLALVTPDLETGNRD
jgi:hypothetical protein